MKKTLLLIFVVSFIACNSEIEEEIIIEQPSETNFVLTENEAISTLEYFIKTLSEDTRNFSELKIIGCTKKKASDFNRHTDVITRANADGIDINSVPVYEITTDTDEGYGFGLVLGDKRFNEVIAFSPEGSLSDTIFNEGLAHFAASIPFIIYEYLDAEKRSVSAAQSTRSDYWPPENYITEDEPCAVVWFDTYNEAYAAYPSYYGPWDTYDTPARYVPVKWSQEAPYNNKVNNFCDGVRGKVGCGAVAMAQVMSFHRHPYKYDWAAITSSQKISPSQTIAVDLVSQLMIDIAIATNTSFNCKKDGLGGSVGSTSTSSYVPAFSFFGYISNLISANEPKVSSALIREGIVNYGPMLMAATSCTLNGVAVNAGHVWVIDAFYKKSRNYYRTTYGWDWTQGGKEFAYVSTYRQHFVVIHCNWGWGGSSDGWYYNFTPINEKYSFANYSLWNVIPNR